MENILFKKKMAGLGVVFGIRFSPVKFTYNRSTSVIVINSSGAGKFRFLIIKRNKLLFMVNGIILSISFSVLFMIS